jgi:TM2 domain-containing membrane protein YozV
MQKARIIIVILLFCSSFFSKAEQIEKQVDGSAFSIPEINFNVVNDSIVSVDVQQIQDILLKHSALSAYIKNHSENKKLIALVLTATLGMLGVHRLYLGTKPWIPAVYLFTFGGCFFILPFIDFVVILISNDISKFENNNRVFMWTN